MQEKKKQYILDDLLRIILAMFVLTVLFAFSCLLLSHGARGIWLAVLAQFTLLGVLGGVFLRRCLRIVQKNEQVTCKDALTPVDLLEGDDQTAHRDILIHEQIQGARKEHQIQRDAAVKAQPLIRFCRAHFHFFFQCGRFIRHN